LQRSLEALEQRHRTQRSPLRPCVVLDVPLDPKSGREGLVCDGSRYDFAQETAEADVVSPRRSRDFEKGDNVLEDTARPRLGAHWRLFQRLKIDCSAKDQSRQAVEVVQTENVHARAMRPATAG
jgi:hypothetical protein